MLQTPQFVSTQTPCLHYRYKLPLLILPSQIRATLYKVYAAVLHAKPELGKKDVVATLMSGLNESQPAVVPHLWHAVLTTVTSVPVSVLIWHAL